MDPMLAQYFNLRKNHYDDTNTYNSELATGAGCNRIGRFAAFIFLFLLLPQMYRREVRHGTRLSHLGSDFQYDSFVGGRGNIEMVFHPALRPGRESLRGPLYVGKSLPGAREERLAGPRDTDSHFKYILYSLSRVFEIVTDCRWCCAGGAGQI
jgi:hypothetical protein